MKRSSWRDRPAENLNNATSNQFTLDFVPPFSYTYMALLPNLGGVDLR